MNSRNKGKRGELLWRDELRANGYPARRGQQFAGSAESPDVICEQLDWIHFEVKAVERLNVAVAMEQARRDSGKDFAPGDQGATGKTPVVVHKRNRRPWLVTMEAQTFFKLIREFQPGAAPRANGAGAGYSGALPERPREARGRPENLGTVPRGTGASLVSQQTENTESKEQQNEDQNQ